MKHNLKSVVAVRVRAARRAKGVTQAALAEAVDRTTEAISNIERGKSLPPLDLLQRIAEVTGSSVAMLVEEPTANGPVGERAQLEGEIAAVAGALPIEHLRIAARQIKALRPSEI